jgi:TetR/AcrR family transcriptional regulator, regulator of cefoperazone and chloramphenicol sensitivity
MFDTIVFEPMLVPFGEKAMSSGEKTRRQLIDAAGPLFAARGLDATSVRDVTNRARANVAAIHFHFRGMEGLYREAVRQAAQSCEARARFPDWPPGTPARQRLRDFIETMLRRVAVDCEPEWHPQLILRELAHPTPACVEFARDFVRPNMEVLVGILRELLPETPPRRVQFCAFSVVGQILFYRFARPVIRELSGGENFRSFDVEVLRDHIYEFSAAALRSLARTGRRAPS